VLSKNSYKKSVFTLGNLLKAHFGIFMLSAKNRDKSIAVPLAVYVSMSKQWVHWCKSAVGNCSSVCYYIWNSLSKYCHLRVWTPKGIVHQPS